MWLLGRGAIVHPNSRPKWFGPGRRRGTIGRVTLYVESKWTGWDGKTFVKLSDGSKWKQAEYLYEYRYAYRPTAQIENGMMLVEGMSCAVRVTRVWS